MCLTYIVQVTIKVTYIQRQEFWCKTRCDIESQTEPGNRYRPLKIRTLKANILFSKVCQMSYVCLVQNQALLAKDREGLFIRPKEQQITLQKTTEEEQLTQEFCPELHK